MVLGQYPLRWHGGVVAGQRVEVGVSHHYKREQRRARIIALIAAVVLLAIAIPLFAMPRLRLDVAETLGVVPNHAREELLSGASGLELVVLVEEIPVEFTLPIQEYTAVYVAEHTSDGVVLHDLSIDRIISVPLQRYDYISAAADRSAILLVDEQARPAQAVLVTIASGEVRELPPGKPIRASRANGPPTSSRGPPAAMRSRRTETGLPAPRALRACSEIGICTFTPPAGPKIRHT